MVVFSDGCTFDLPQFFVFAKEEESLGNEFALAKGERVPYQETMVIEYLLCLNMFPLIREYTRSSIGWETVPRWDELCHQQGERPSRLGDGAMMITR